MNAQLQDRIHPTALIAPGAEIGRGVEVAPYSVIGPEVKIGDGCRIASHVVIEGRTTLGPENEVFQFASLGAAPQDLKYRGEPSTLVIGAKNKIRECVTLHPGTAAGAMTTVIGNNNLFMANSHVAHDCRVGNNNVFANSVALAGHVTIDNNIILGGMAGIHQFCRVGDYSIVGAGSMVSQDCPPYCIVQGDRASLRGVNVIALERAGMSAEEISAIRKVYRLLFSSVGRLKEKISALPPELTSEPRVKAMIDFIVSSKRGVLNPAKHSKQEV